MPIKKRIACIEVNPHHSKMIQTLAFANGIYWSSGSQEIMMEEKTYLYITQYVGKRPCLTWDSRPDDDYPQLSPADAAKLIIEMGLRVHQEKVVGYDFVYDEDSQEIKFGCQLITKERLKWIEECVKPPTLMHRFGEYSINYDRTREEFWWYDRGVKKTLSANEVKALLRKIKK